MPIELNRNYEKNILTLAFHNDIQTFEKAEEKLSGEIPGTFLTFSANGQNFCSVVTENREIRHNPFRWDVSGRWYNFSPTPYATEEALLDHLVYGQISTPLYN